MSCASYLLLFGLSNAEYRQAEWHQWALANRLRYHPQGQGLCLTQERPLFSWPASGGKWLSKRTFSALWWNHCDRTVRQQCSIMEGSHNAPNTRLSCHLCLLLFWMKCPRVREALFGKLLNDLRSENNVLFAITQFACTRKQVEGQPQPLQLGALSLSINLACFWWQGEPEPTYSTQKRPDCNWNFNS